MAAAVLRQCLQHQSAQPVLKLGQKKNQLGCAQASLARTCSRRCIEAMTAMPGVRTTASPALKRLPHKQFSLVPGTAISLQDLAELYSCSAMLCSKSQRCVQRHTLVLHKNGHDAPMARLPSASKCLLKRYPTLAAQRP